MPAHAVRRSDVQPLAQRIVAESLGTAFLLAGVVGSGIMAAKGARNCRLEDYIFHHVRPISLSLFRIVKLSSERSGSAEKTAMR